VDSKELILFLEITIIVPELYSKFLGSNSFILQINEKRYYENGIQICNDTIELCL
jgi:hypothetical protein